MPETESAPPTMSTEVSRSIATVWKRYAASRPADAHTEISGRVVRCTITDAVEDFENGMAERLAAEGEGARDMTSYRREASAAVAKATGRRVMAFVSDHDSKTDVATEIFVLDSSLRPVPIGEEGWIAR